MALSRVTRLGVVSIATTVASGIMAAGAAPTFAITAARLKADPGETTLARTGRTALDIDDRSGVFTADWAFGVLEVRYQGRNGEGVHMCFAAPGGVAPTAGTYERAQLCMQQSPTRPGLAVVVGFGYGCDELDGTFVVFESDVSPDGTVNSFAVNFEQHCNHEEPALRGAIRFNSSVPFDAPTPTAPPATPTPLRWDFIAQIDSEPGDYIGFGQRYVLTNGDGVLTATHERGGVSLRFYGGIENRWRFSFSAPDGKDLVPGAYELARGAPSGNPWRPHIAVSSPGRGCGSVGRFDVLEAEFGPDGEVERLAVDFVQRCDQSVPSLTGSLRVRSAIPLAPWPTPTPTPGPHDSFLRLDGETFDERQGVFVTRHILGRAQIVFFGLDGRSILGVELAVPQCSDIAPGVYEDVGPYLGPGPGISASFTPPGGASVYCPGGRFEIRAAALGDNGELLRLDTDFEVDCRPYYHVVTGSLHYVSRLPTPVATPTPHTDDRSSVAVLDSDPFEFVGDCQHYELTLANGRFRAEYDERGLTVFYEGDDYWNFSFAAPGGGPPAVGVYEDAAGWPFQGPLRPGMSIGGRGNGCSHLVGRFIVRESVLGPDGVVERFAAEFEQHCSELNPALVGIIRYNSTLPPPSPPPPGAATRTPALLPCQGDCDGDRRVSVSELITSVNVVLGSLPLPACQSLDWDRNGIVGIAELVGAVGEALQSCRARG